MARANAHLHAFNVGEISKAGLARVDQARTRLAAEIQENILPAVVGKGQFRPGLKYIASTSGNAVTWPIPFAKSVDDTAILWLTDGAVQVMIGDEYLTRPAVTSSVTNGNFSSGTGWTLATSGGAEADIDSTVSGALYMNCPARGGAASCERSVSTSSAGVEHALRIAVTRGPVTFRCGSTSGADDYVTETVLETGTHSLAFTPSGTYYVKFLTKRHVAVIVDSIAVESAGVVSLPGPWTAAQFASIRHAQSLDEIFIAHTAWRTRRIQRNNNARSWSVVEYRTEDGPFMLQRYADVKLTPGATFGNTTLSADVPFFRPSHVGCLFRLFHDQTNITIRLGANGEYTDAVRVNGINDDNNLVREITGTWVGTLQLQRSYTSATEAFVDVTSQSTAANLSNTYNSGGSDLDNVVHWYRYAFTAYTSGTASIRLAYTGDAKAGICRVTGFTSSTQVDIEILSPFGNVTATKEWLEGAWSDRSGWPSAAGLIDGRMMFGRGDRWWTSESDGYYSYSLDTEGDKASIQRAIATGGGASTIRWLMPLQRMLAGTADQVASIRSGALNEQLSPESTTVKDSATIGCADIAPVRVDNRGIFIGSGRQKVYELATAVDSGDYDAHEITALNEDIGGDGTLTSLAIQREPETYIWHTRSDGQCPVLLYEPKQEAAAYVRVVSDGADGQIENVCILPGEIESRVYVVVKRTINGSTVRYIEKMALLKDARGRTWNLMADSFVTASGPVSSVTATHLANETGLVGWGYADGIGTPLTGLSADGSGVIQLGATYTHVCVGLPYTGRYKSAKLAYGSQAGTALLQPKRVNAIGLLLADTHKDALRYGRSFDDLFPMPDVERGVVVTGSAALYDVYDEMSFPFPGNWDTDSRVCIELSAPYPATLLGLVVGVETNDRV